MRKHLSLIAILLFCCATTFSQTREIKGKILDAADNSPLTGVTISIKGSKSAVLSAANGSFTIKAGPQARALHFSYIGYDNKDIPIGDDSGPITVLLATTKKSLNEVVIVGYGKAAKKDITGSITKVSGTEVKDFPAPSFESALQGKAPGVVIESGSGRLGQAIKINIRGISSLSAGTQPLYVIDGLPFTSSSMSDPTNDATNPLADINPNDIESLEILKDASAAAIYGARGANGVILITTKKGKNGSRTNIELDANTGISNPARKWKYMDASQYAATIKQAALNDANYDFQNNISGFTSQAAALNYYQNDPTIGYFTQMNGLARGTDWQNAQVNTNWQNLSFYKNAPNSQINLSASGGNDKTRFFVSGNYSDQQSIMIKNKFTRYGARFNLEHNASDKLVLGINFALDRSQLNRVTFDNATSSPALFVLQPPIAPPADSSGHYYPTILLGNGLLDAQHDYDHQVTFRTVGNAFAEYRFIPSLSFRSELGTDILNLTENEFQGLEGIDGGGIGMGESLFSQSVSLNTNNYFTFTPHINDDHKLSSVLGMSYLQNDLLQSTINAQSYLSDNITNLNGATNVTAGNTQNYRYTFLSYFLRANYAYKERYLLSASIRTDGSSRFSPKYRYGWFPAVSAGWILSEENFLKNSPAISMLKLRASYGLAGNSEIGESQYQSLYGVTNYPGLPGFTPSQLGTPNLRWEKTQQTDIGLDYGFLHDRLTGTIDYYKKHTTDLLLNTNIPSTTGYYNFGSGSSTIYENLGKMDNSGFEFSISSKNLTGAFKWSTTFNIAYNKNKVGYIGGQIIENSGQRAAEGHPIGSYYLQKFLGVDPANGNALYADSTGKATSNYNAAARFYQGKYPPDYTAGFANTFSYKGFDLYAFFYGVTGNTIYQQSGQYISNGFAGGSLNNQTVNILNAWTKPGDITNVPRVSANFPTGGNPSSRYLFNGRYIRLKNLTLGYSLPHAITSGLNISSARFYISAVNLFTFTKYPGDPEVNTYALGKVNGGTDFFTIPQAKTFSFGLSVKF